MWLNRGSFGVVISVVKKRQFWDVVTEVKKGQFLWLLLL